MTSDVKRRLLAILLLVAAGASWWFLQAVTEQKAIIETVKKQDPDYYMENIRATVMDADGERKYTLTAESMQHYPHNDTVRLAKPHLIQYDVGRTPVHTWADFAWLDKTKKEVVMTGNVKIVRGANSSGQTSEITTTMVRILLN